jgi:hypothetical protein
MARLLNGLNDRAIAGGKMNPGRHRDPRGDEEAWNGRIHLSRPAARPAPLEYADGDASAPNERRNDGSRLPLGVPRRCGDKTTFAREIAEAALAHAIENEVEGAYVRGDAL